MDEKIESEMKTYLEWHYDEKPPRDSGYIVAIKIKPSEATYNSVMYYRAGRWTHEDGVDLSGRFLVYAWAYFPEPPPVDIDAA